MRRPDLRNDNARGTAGIVGEAGVQRELNSAKFAPHGATISDRRAQSIRLQALGQIGGTL